MYRDLKINNDVGENASALSERHSGVVVSTSALHGRVLSSRPRPGMGMFDVKTWLSILGTV